MADIELTGLEFPRTHSALVSTLSVLRPLCGMVRTDEARSNAIHTVRRRWRARLTALHEADWQAIQSSRCQFARNCPPCSVRAFPPTRPCQLPICPFCYGRQNEQLFHRLEIGVRELQANGDPFRLVSWSFTDGNPCPATPYYGNPFQFQIDPSEGDDPAEHDFESGIHSLLFWDDVRRTKLMRAMSRRIFGAIYRLSVWPIGSRPEDKDPHRTEFPFDGEWRTRNSILLLVPPQWQPPRMPTHIQPRLQTFSTSSMASLARAVGYTFSYPRQWMRGNARAVAGFLNNCRSERPTSRYIQVPAGNPTTKFRFVTTYGCLRGQLQLP